MKIIIYSGKGITQFTILSIASVWNAIVSEDATIPKIEESCQGIQMTEACFYTCSDIECTVIKRK